VCVVWGEAALKYGPLLLSTLLVSEYNMAFDKKDVTIIKTLLDIGVEKDKFDKWIIQMIRCLLEDMEPTRLTVPEIDAGRNKSKLDAVRMYKERKDCGIIEAKKAVEEYFAMNNLLFAASPPKYH